MRNTRYDPKYWKQCTSLLVFLLIIDVGDFFDSHDASSKCETITIPLCKEGIGYNKTIFPNLLKHQKQDDAAVEIEQFSPLVKINCSNRIRFFLCSYYAPVCTVLEEPIKPCRRLCQQVKDGCELLMNKFGFEWPTFFNCDVLPNGGLCVGENITEASTSIPDVERDLQTPQDNNGKILLNDTILAPTKKVWTPVFLLFTTMYDIHLLDIPSKDLITLFSSQESIAPVDFYYANNWVFWASNSEGKIFRGTIKLDVLREVKPIVDTAPAVVESIAVDWYASRLYWVETYPNRIRLATFDGHYPTTIVTAGDHSSKSLVVDPEERRLFWIDLNGILYSASSAIKSCDMSGGSLQTVYNITQSDSGRPLGLTADRKARKLYWADARSESLHSIDYDGSIYTLIMVNHDFLSEVNSLAVFGGYMFWTDRTTSSVNRLTLRETVRNELYVKDVKRLETLTASPPLDMKVFHPEIQTPGTPRYNVTLDLTAVGIEYPVYDGSGDDERSHKAADTGTATSTPTTFLLFLLTILILSTR